MNLGMQCHKGWQCIEDFIHFNTCILERCPARIQASTRSSGCTQSGACLRWCSQRTVAFCMWRAQAGCCRGVEPFVLRPAHGGWATILLQTGALCADEYHGHWHNRYVNNWMTTFVEQNDLQCSCVARSLEQVLCCICQQRSGTIHFSGVPCTTSVLGWRVGGNLLRCVCSFCMVTQKFQFLLRARWFPKSTHRSCVSQYALCTFWKSPHQYNTTGSLSSFLSVILPHVVTSKAT
jgi:hypothetical protein